MNAQRCKPAVLAAAMISSALLIGSGCGNSNQTDGELVTPTEEVESSRAAMSNQIEQNPNMYAPTQQRGR
ncbi:hypothetical protein [Tautonia plasticadhaerens]|nr:hypothetical protein [Tautonia plasticadhaerens]